jgi:hypothetical protein
MKKIILLFYVLVFSFLALIGNDSALAQEEIKIVIDEPGEGISHALFEYYLGVGMDESSAREKMYYELKNPVFYKDGVLQDLVHIGDEITLSSDGVVVFFKENSSFVRGRLPDAIDMISDNEIQIGREKVTFPEDIYIETVRNSVDQHANVVITDKEGTSHKIVAYNENDEIYVNGGKIILENWISSTFSDGVSVIAMIEDNNEVKGDNEERMQSANLFISGFTFSCSYFVYMISIVVLVAALYYLLSEYEHNKGWITVLVILVGTGLTFISFYNCSIILPILSGILILVLGWEYRDKLGIKK